jgi:pimeloyl-ACP methyl ester carboxylesterase
LIAAISNQKTVLLKDCGHMQMIEKAADVRTALIDFL